MSNVVLNQKRVASAIVAGKPSIKVEGKLIKLPTPQRSGTLSQQQAYAMQWAEKHIN